MPKIRARRKGSARIQRSSRQAGVTAQEKAELAARPDTATRPVRKPINATSQGSQGLIMPAMVALGSWGLAISFAFFSTDPNHLLWSGMAILMGMMWSLSFWLRLRKLRRR